MDEKHRETGERTTDREASNGRDDDHRSRRDELARRREEGEPRQPLTPRERQERWPIG